MSSCILETKKEFTTPYIKSMSFISTANSNGTISLAGGFLSMFIHFFSVSFQDKFDTCSELRLGHKAQEEHTHT